MIGNMDKFTVDEIQQIWGIWESRYDESFVDYFLDDNINNMGIVLGYWSAKYPELFRYIMNMTDWCIPWEYIQDSLTNYGSLDRVVEDFYGVEANGWNEERYEESLRPWCSLIHDVDIYYERFNEWLKNQSCYDEIMKELEEWKRSNSTK